MPGIAAIRLTWEPTDPSYNDAEMALLQGAFDTVFTRATERALSARIWSGDQAQADLRARLDEWIKATPIGDRAAGAVTAAPPPAAPPWSWGGDLHSGPRKLLLNGKAFVIEAGAEGELQAEVQAVYSWRSAEELPAPEASRSTGKLR
jgi:hypothetical protein